MRIEFTVRLDTEVRHSVMSDWITRLKREEEEAEKASELSTKRRLHEAKGITAKAPAFWEDLVDCLKDDASRLREAFPQDNERQCSVALRGNSCSVQGQKAPFTVLNLTFNVDGMCIDARWDSGDRKREQPTRRSTRFNLRLNVAEDLYVSNEDQTYTNPAHLAEYLIKRVCNIKD